MRILALETTDKTGSVAALGGGTLLAELELNPQQRSAQSLAPAIRDLLGKVGWSPSDIELVAVAVGPGSFTGLRVGVTTAKMLAYALKAEVLGVNTLEVIANQVSSEVADVWVMMDASRQELFTGHFVRGSDGWFEWAGEMALVKAEDWLRSLPERVVVSGPGLKSYAERFQSGVTPVAQEVWQPRAAMVGQLAHRQHQAGRREDFWKLVPLYIRLSAAEEKRAREAGQN